LADRAGGGLLVGHLDHQDERGVAVAVAVHAVLGLAGRGALVGLQLVVVEQVDVGDLVPGVQLGAAFLRTFLAFERHVLLGCRLGALPAVTTVAAALLLGVALVVGLRLVVGPEQEERAGRDPGQQDDRGHDRDDLALAALGFAVEGVVGALAPFGRVARRDGRELAAPRRALVGFGGVPRLLRLGEAGCGGGVGLLESARGGGMWLLVRRLRRDRLHRLRGFRVGGLHGLGAFGVVCLTTLRLLRRLAGRRGHRGDDLRGVGVAALVRLLRCGRLLLGLLTGLLRLALWLSLLRLALRRLLGLLVRRRLAGLLRGALLGLLLGLLGLLLGLLGLLLGAGVVAVCDGRRQHLVAADAVVVRGESARSKLLVQLAQLFLPGHRATPCLISAVECRRPLLRVFEPCSFCTVCRL